MTNKALSFGYVAVLSVQFCAAGKCVVPGLSSGKTVAASGNHPP